MQTKVKRKIRHILISPAVYVGFICLLSLSSCSSDMLYGDEESSFTIEQAKSYFEDNTQGLSLVEYLQPSTKSLVPSRFENITPDWENAKIRIKNGVVTIAASLIDSKTYRATLELTAGKKKIATEDGVSFSSFLIVQKNTITEKICRYVVTLVGHNNTGSSVFFGENTDFRGIMMYSTEEGRCFRAYEVNKSHFHRLFVNADTSSVEAGENKMAVKFGFSVSSHIDTRGGGGNGGYSSGEDNYHYCYMCGNLTDFTAGSCAKCGSPFFDGGGNAFYYYCPKCGRTEEDCICHLPPPEMPSPTPCRNCNDPYCDGSCVPGGPPYDDGDPDVPGDNPKDPTPSSPGSSLGPFHVHKQGEYLIPDVYDNYPTQLSGCCTICTLNYTSVILGKIIGVEDLLLHCYQNYSVITTDDALTYSQTMELYNHYLCMTDEYSIIGALDLRYPVLGIISYGETNLHCVAIVGYNPDYTLIAMDPASGRLTDIESDRITNHAAVTGIKM